MRLVYRKKREPRGFLELWKQNDERKLWFRNNIDEILDSFESLTPEEKQKIKQDVMESTEHLVKYYRGSK
jgi:ClpP class serine protease